MTHTIEWLLGVFLVFIYARGRFRTPKSNIASTTRFRYSLASWSYYGANLLLFYFLSALLESSPQIVHALIAGGPGLPKEAGALTSPMLAALLMTTLLPNFPLLRQMDQWLLDVFRDIGNIPSEVRLWRDRLVELQPDIPEAAQGKLIHLVDSDPRFAAFSANDLRFEADDSPRYTFTKIVYLMTVIEAFRVDRAYRRILEEFADEYVAIKARFDQVLGGAARCFQATDPDDGNDNAVAVPDEPISVLECKRAFRERCDELYSDMCQLIARGVLRCEPSRGARLDTIEKMGFPPVERTETAFSINQLVTIVGMVFVILFSAITVIGARTGTANLANGIYIAAMVAVIYGVAVFCGILPKETWRLAQRRPNDYRPAAAYVLSGVMAAGGAAIVSLLFKSLYYLDFYKALVDFGWSYPWLTMSFATGLSVAYLIDDWATTEAPFWGRWLEGLALAVLLAGVSWLVGEMISQIPDVPQERVPVQPFVAVVSGVIGLAIGFFVPSWYRRRMQLGAEDRIVPGQDAPTIPSTAT